MREIINKLIKENKKETRGIALSNIFISIIIIASMMYITYSMDIYLKELDRKYHNSDIVMYTKDKSPIKEEDIDFEHKSINKRADIKGEINGVNLLVQVVDNDGYEEVLPLFDIYGKEIIPNDGIALSKSLYENLDKPDKVSLKINNKSVDIKVSAIYDPKQTYDSFTNDISAKIFNNTNKYFISEDFNFDKAYISSPLDQQEIRDIEYNQQRYGLINVDEEKDMVVKETSQSFIYAVSFIIIALLSVVFAGVYNFSKLVLQQNLGQIGMFRSMGITFNNAISIVYKMIFKISAISFLIGLILAEVLANVLIGLEYGFKSVVLPSFISITLAGSIVIIMPLLTVSALASKYKKQSPINLLNTNRSMSYDTSKDNIRAYIINFVIFLAIFITLRIISLPYQVRVITGSISIYALVKLAENGSIIIMDIISKLPMDGRNAEISLAMKNMARLKNRKATIMGTFILILSIFMAMYAVFNTFRQDAVNKVEAQFNADIFITDFSLKEDTLKDVIGQIEKIDGLAYLEVANKEYVSIDNHQIMSYNLSEKDFLNSFNYKEINGTEIRDIDQDKIMVGESLAIAGGIKRGDSVDIRRGKEDKTYEVSNIIDSNEYMGNVVYIFNSPNKVPNTISLILDDKSKTKQVYKQVKEIFKDASVISPKISSKEMVKENFKKNAIKGTQFIELMLIVIVSVGTIIFANQFVQYIDMQLGEYSLLAILGMDDKKIKKMVGYELTLMAMLGAVLSFLTGLLLTKDFVDIAASVAKIGRVWQYHYDYRVGIIVLLYSLIIFAIIMFVKIRRIDINDKTINIEN